MIDSHHHLWSYSKEEYPWIPDGSVLARDYLAADLESTVAGSDISGTIVVQARQTLEESRVLLEVAAHSKLILGVVGWIPLTSERVNDDLEQLSRHRKLKGIRHVLQDEANEYFSGRDFNRGLAQLPEFGLLYELLIFQRQIPSAIELVDRHPGLGMVVDHIAKPSARNGRIEVDWKVRMQELAKRDNVLAVKFSGLINEFPKGTINPETLRIYFEETVEIFGANRVIFGSDWPVCLLRTNYSAWINDVLKFADTLSQSEHESIFGGNASRIYCLQFD